MSSWIVYKSFIFRMGEAVLVQLSFNLQLLYNQKMLFSLLLSIGFVFATASAGCPTGWKTFGGDCYLLLPQIVATYASAEKKCDDYEAVLVSPETKDKNDFLKNMLDEARDDGILSFGSTVAENTEIWLAARRPNTSSPFMWKTGSSLVYTDWKPGQPSDNLGNPTQPALCMQMGKNQGASWTWWVSRCDEGNPDNAVVCEKKTGSLKLDNEVPYMLVGSAWMPICGHYFWDNNIGADIICQNLGFQGGVLEKERGPYSEDAYYVGRCDSRSITDLVNGCTKEILAAQYSCKKGSPVSIKVKCKECNNGGKLLSLAPDKNMALCKDIKSNTCEKDLFNLCPVGWHLCNPKEFNKRNDGWSYTTPALTFGQMYCRLNGGTSPFVITRPLNKDDPGNCGHYWSSRPGCDLWEGAQYGDGACNNKEATALCCAPAGQCGNGAVDSVEEECDDGNDNELDDCLNSCAWRTPAQHGLNYC